MEELIFKAKNGDNDAYKELIDTIKDVLYRIARSRLDSEEDIYDAMNETIFKAYMNLKKLKKNEYFQTWIIRILINECNRIYNKNKKSLKLIKKLEEIEQREIHENSLNNVENKMSFESLIEILNKEEKIVFVLYFYSKYDTSEIAKILKENPNTIKSRLKRGKEKVSKFLKGGVEYEK